uniref:Uncharacterized protein n=1 Tax=Mycena chlorophos TaxID=658473 RepID=A0ABQ0M8L1_MYCCL|nr:predicted protein [Mycena chlorophos]
MPLRRGSRLGHHVVANSGLSTPPTVPPTRNTSPPLLQKFAALLPTKHTKDAADGIRTALEVLECACDAFPPLKSAVAGVCALWDLADKCAGNQDDARELAAHATEILDSIYCALNPQRSAPPSSVLPHFLRFESVLLEIRKELEGLSSESRVKQFFHLRRNQSVILHSKTKLDRAYVAFMVGLQVAQAVRASRCIWKLKMFHFGLRLRPR